MTMAFWYAGSVECRHCHGQIKFLVSTRTPFPIHQTDALEVTCGGCGGTGQFNLMGMALHENHSPDHSLPEARWVNPPGGR